jgi:hypothetical protein
VHTIRATIRTIAVKMIVKMASLQKMLTNSKNLSTTRKKRKNNYPQKRSKLLSTHTMPLYMRKPRKTTLLTALSA